MNKTNFFLVLFLIAFVIIVFFRFGAYLASGEEELMFSDADVEEIVLTQDEDDLINTVRLVYKWDGCYQGTTTCEEYIKNVTMSAHVD